MEAVFILGFIAGMCVVGALVLINHYMLKRDRRARGVAHG